MAQLDQYKNYVTDLINEYASYKPADNEIEMQAITDHEHGHYQQSIN